MGSQKGTYCELEAKGRNTFLREGLSAELWMIEASLAKSQGKNLPEEVPRRARHDQNLKQKENRDKPLG